MRLLQAMAGAPVGGAENFFSRLAPALARAGIEQHVLMRPEPGRTGLLRDCGIPVVEAPFHRLDFATPRRFRAEIEAFRPHVVLSWMNRATLYTPPSGRPPGFVHLGTPRGYYAAKYYRHCDHLVCTTDHLVEHFTAAGWPTERITRIANFCSDELAATPQSRAELETPDGAPLVLALGRLHANKGFDVLLKALARLPDHYLWLAGSGKLERRLKRLAEELGVTSRVRFLGWRGETAPLFAAADMFACPSRIEPFGNIIIEAWAQLVPVVAAAASGPGALIEDGRSGLLVPVDDGAALAAALDRVRREDGLATALAAAGRDVYERGFTEEVVVRAYLDLFERLAG